MQEASLSDSLFKSSNPILEVDCMGIRGYQITIFYTT